MIYTSFSYWFMHEKKKKKKKTTVSHRAKKLYDLLLSVNGAVFGICYDFLT